MKHTLRLTACSLAALCSPTMAAPTVFDNAAGAGDNDFRNALNWTAGSPEGSIGTATHPAMVQSDAILSGGAYSTDAHIVVQNNATWTVDAGVSYVASKAVNQGKIFTSGANAPVSSAIGTGHSIINGLVDVTNGTYGYSVGHSSYPTGGSTLNLNNGGTIKAVSFTVREMNSVATFHPGSVFDHTYPEVSGWDPNIQVLNGGRLNQNTTITRNLGTVRVDGPGSIFTGSGSANIDSTLTVTNGGSFTSSGTTLGSFDINGGAVFNAGNSTVTVGSFSVVNGSIVQLAGNLTLNASGSVNLTDSSLSAQTIDLNGTDLNVSGTGTATFDRVLVRGGTTMNVTSGGTVTVNDEIDLKPGAFLDVDADASFTVGELNRLRLRNNTETSFIIAADGSFTAINGDATNGMIINLGGTPRLDVTFEGAPTLGEFYDLFTGVASFNNFDDTQSGSTFDPANVSVNGLAPGQDVELSYDTSVANNGFLRVTVIPEPSGALLLSLGALAILRRRR